MILALQALPLLLLIGLLFSGRVAPVPAVLAALAAAIPAAFVSLPGGVGLPGFLGEQILRGAYLALQPMGVVLAGLLFHAAVSEAEASAGATTATPRRIFIATLLLGCFLESVTGFGVGAVFALASLRGMGVIGAPAGAIGNYGGEVDNWQWPRHTGDFSFLRAYVSKDGKPAAYSPDNSSIAFFASGGSLS